MKCYYGYILASFPLILLLLHLYAIRKMRVDEEKRVVIVFSTGLSFWMFAIMLVYYGEPPAFSSLHSTYLPTIVVSLILGSIFIEEGVRLLWKELRGIKDRLKILEEKQAVKDAAQ